jgi:hypothetical protein
LESSVIYSLLIHKQLFCSWSQIVLRSYLCWLNLNAT